MHPVFLLHTVYYAFALTLILRCPFARSTVALLLMDATQRLAIGARSVAARTAIAVVSCTNQYIRTAMVRRATRGVMIRTPEREEEDDADEDGWVLVGRSGHVFDPTYDPSEPVSAREEQPRFGEFRV
jgi:hypothetical protein